MAYRAKLNPIRMNVFMSEGIYAKLKALADKRCTTVSGIIRDILIEYFEGK